MAGITNVADAPLPTPSPWEGQAPGSRCPACGCLDPGNRSCSRCRATLRVRVDRRLPLSATMVNVAVILFGRGPLLLAVAYFLNTPGESPFNPWTYWIVALVPFQWLAMGGLYLRWRWSWFLACAVSGVDMLGTVVLQILAPGHSLVPIAMVAVDLMIIGLLLMTYDEVRVTYDPIGTPAEHAWPTTPAGAYDAGVTHSRAGHWYLAALLWQRAVALGHHEGRYRRALALAYMRLGELAAAESELAAARFLLPDDAQTASLHAALAKLKAARP